MSSISSAALADGLSQLQQIFSKTDTDKNGSLSQTEFTTAIKNIPGLNGSGTTADQLFKKLDKDGDGQLSSTELTDGANLAQKVQDALLKAQELMSGSTLMDIIGGKSAMAQASAAANSSSASDTMFNTGSSGATDDSGINALIQQIMSSYQATDDAAKDTTANATRPLTGVSTSV